MVLSLVPYFSIVIILALGVDSRSVFGPFEDEISEELHFDSSEDDPSGPQIFDNRDSFLEEPRFRSPKAYMLTFRSSPIITNPNLERFGFQQYPRRNMFNGIISPPGTDHIDDYAFENTQRSDKNADEYRNILDRMMVPTETDTFDDTNFENTQRFDKNADEYRNILNRMMVPTETDTFDDTNFENSHPFARNSGEYKNILNRMMVPSGTNHFDDSEPENTQMFGQNWNNEEKDENLESMESVEGKGQSGYMSWRKPTQESVEQNQEKLPPLGLVMLRLYVKEMLKNIKEKEQINQNTPHNKAHDNQIQEIESIVKIMPTVVQV